MTLSITPNYKTTYICSAHFRDDCYFDLDNQTMYRRLLPTAVPCISVSYSDKIDTQECASSDTGNNMQEDEDIERFSSGVLNGNTTVITSSKEDDCDFDLDNQTRRKTLLPSAVPCISVSQFDQIHTQKCENSNSENDMQEVESMERCSSEVLEGENTVVTNCKEDDSSALNVTRNRKR